MHFLKKIRSVHCNPNCNTTAQEPSSATSSDDDDYGYDTPSEQQQATLGNVVGESLLHARANRARVEALNYLDDRERFADPF